MSGLLSEVIADLQSAPAQTVVYLEGRTDPDVFFALLGERTPRDGVHAGVLVKGLSVGAGSGARAVRDRVDLASRERLGRVFGIIDGDGEPLAALAARHDPPFAGPCFQWKAYCIENLLAKAEWPGAFGPRPDWTQTLLDHAPYVALNALRRELNAALETLGLARFTRPVLGEARKTVADVAAALARDKHLVERYDAAARFAAAVADYESRVRASVDEGHALANGKWFVDVLAPERTGLTPHACRAQWVDRVRANGGHGEAKSLWRRITGRMP